MTFPVQRVHRVLADLSTVCAVSGNAVDEGCNYIVLSDRGVSADRAPIPSLLATSAVHHHLIDCKKRVQTALIVETAERVR